MSLLDAEVSGAKIQHKSMFEKGKVQGCSHVCEKAVLFETL
jgi:hypothetical protein